MSNSSASPQERTPNMFSPAAEAAREILRRRGELPYSLTLWPDDPEPSEEELALYSVIVRIELVPNGPTGYLSPKGVSDEEWAEWASEHGEEAAAEARQYRERNPP